MLAEIDKRIAALESELTDLKRRKIALLQQQVAQIEATLSGAPPPKNKGGRPRKNPLPFASAPAPAAPAVKNKGGRPRKNPLPFASTPAPAAPAVKNKGGRPRKNPLPAAPVAAPVATAKSKGPKKRGRKPGKRVPDEQVMVSVNKLVLASGKEGISARKVSQITGIHYPRILKLMDKHFRKSGERKWTRYHGK